MRAFLVAAALTVGVVRSAASQALPPHAYLPLDHWAVPLLEHLVRRGLIDDPTPLVRPWRISDVTHALVRADTLRMSRSERATRRDLLTTFPPSAAAHTIAVAGALGGRGSTQARRAAFALRDTGDGYGTPRIGFGFGIQFGPGLLIMHPAWDGNIDADPEFAGREQPLNVRFEEAYGAFRSRYFDLDIGNVDRNWGPVEVPGLLISNWPLSYDHVFLRAGHERIYLMMLIAQLDPAVNSQGELDQRFFFAHRLAAHPWDWVDVAAWQGTITAAPSRGLDLYYLNPFKTTFETRDARNDRANVWLGGEGRLHFGRWMLEGALTVDDIQLFKSGGVADEEPPAFALTASASVPIGPVAVWAGYTLVSNLMYRTHEATEKALTAFNPARNRPGTGLARNYSDYDQLSARATVIPVAGVLIRPELTLLRQGEGDPRLPFPAAADFAATPTLFQGIRERTVRVALAGVIRVPFGIDVEFDAGVHHIANAGHVSGATDTRFVGTLAARYAIEHLWPFR